MVVVVVVVGGLKMAVPFASAVTLIAGAGTTHAPSESGVPMVVVYTTPLNNAWLYALTVVVISASPTSSLKVTTTLLRESESMSTSAMSNAVSSVQDVGFVAQLCVLLHAERYPAVDQEASNLFLYRKQVSCPITQNSHDGLAVHLAQQSSSCWPTVAPCGEEVAIIVPQQGFVLVLAAVHGPLN